MAALDIDHVALPVRDARETHRFYAKVLGLSLAETFSGDDWDGYPWLMMIYADANGRRIALCAFGGLAPAREAIPTDARHYAFAARSLAPWRRRLAAAKVRFREEDHGDQRSIYFEDPSGNILEITSPARRAIDAKSKRGAEAEIDRWAARAG